MNAIATLMDNIKKAIGEKNVVFVLAFDIKRAFDNVSRIRLIKRLLNQKIPLLLI